MNKSLECNVIDCWLILDKKTDKFNIACQIKFRISGQASFTQVIKLSL